MNSLLLTAFRRSIKVQSHPEYLFLFEKYCEVHKVAKFALLIHYKICCTFIGDLFIAAYGLASMLRLSYPKNPQKKLISAWGQVNEKNEIEKLSIWFPHYEIKCIDKKLSNIVSLKSFLFFLSLFKYQNKIKVYLRIIRRLSSRYEFVTVCRVVEQLSFYIRLSSEFKRRPARAVIVAGPFGIEAAALLLAARAVKVPTIFSSRAYPPSSIEDCVPIETDFALLEGEVSQRNYQKASTNKFEYVFKGVDGHYAPMHLEALKSGKIRMGVFMGKSYEQTSLLKFLAYFAVDDKFISVLIRPHPVRLFDHDFNKFLLNKKFKLSIGDTPMDEDLKNCDIIFAGNSNSHLQILKSGIPSVYLACLDTAKHDLYGFVSEGILYELKEFDKLSLAKVVSFYDSRWVEKFRTYDATYDEDIVEMKVKVNDALKKFLKDANQ